MGAIFAGCVEQYGGISCEYGNVFRGLPTGLYTNSTAEECHYILENSRANIVVVGNEDQLKKICLVMIDLCYLKSKL